MTDLQIDCQLFQNIFYTEVNDFRANLFIVTKMPASGLSRTQVKLNETLR